LAKHGKKKAGITEEDAQSEMAFTHGLSFLMMCVISFGINYVINMHDPADQTFVDGAFYGVLASALYCVPAVAINYLYQKKSLKLFTIDAGYVLNFCALSGGVMAALNIG
jgi:hypothetical protein